MINAEKVTELFYNSLFKEEELVDGKPTSEPILVEGIIRNFGFHQRVLEKKEELIEIIAELPETFKEGWTFLNLCQTKDEVLWTGSQKVCEQLVVMCIANGLMEYTFPKELWRTLPGCVPYITVK